MTIDKGHEGKKYFLKQHLRNYSWDVQLDLRRPELVKQANKKREE